MRNSRHCLFEPLVFSDQHTVICLAGEMMEPMALGMHAMTHSGARILPCYACYYSTCSRQHLSAAAAAGGVSLYGTGQ